MVRIFLELIRICWDFRNREWYCHFPFLPLPPKKYLQWRIETAYGDKSFRNLRWNDVKSFARWHRLMRLNASSLGTKMGKGG
jgi:hypothetical protein